MNVVELVKLSPAKYEEREATHASKHSKWRGIYARQVRGNQSIFHRSEMILRLSLQQSSMYTLLMVGDRVLRPESKLVKKLSLWSIFQKLSKERNIIAGENLTVMTTKRYSYVQPSQLLPYMYIISCYFPYTLQGFNTVKIRTMYSICCL